MFSGRVVLLSTGVLSTVLALRLSVPAISVFLCSQVPRIYGAALVWLTPPYLYFVINIIIISIAASARFHKPAGPEDGEAAAVKVPAEIRRDKGYPSRAPVAFEVIGGREVAEEVGERAGFVVPGEVYGGGRDATEVKVVVVKEKEEAASGESEEEFVISRSSWTPKRRDSWEQEDEVAPAAAAAEKPLVSVRFAPRRGVKSSPEGRALGVARQKKSETLENTWKAITDGRAMPLARHLKKSDTWGADAGRAWEEEAAARTPVRKSETLKDRRVAAESSPSPGSSGGSRSGRLRREASLGLDELNRRVEAFINKFNEEMRLQRQESFKHYVEMINRGSQ